MPTTTGCGPGASGSRRSPNWLGAGPYLMRITEGNDSSDSIALETRIRVDDSRPGPGGRVAHARAELLDVDFHRMAIRTCLSCRSLISRYTVKRLISRSPATSCALSHCRRSCVRLGGRSCPKPDDGPDQDVSFLGTA